MGVYLHKDKSLDGHKISRCNLKQCKVRSIGFWVKNNSLELAKTISSSDLKFTITGQYSKDRWFVCTRGCFVSYCMSKGWISVIQEYFYWKIEDSFYYLIKILITQYAVDNFSFFFLISLWEYIIYIQYDNLVF